MIGLDTNLVVRLLITDETPQTLLARQFVQERCSPDVPAFINSVVLAETIWVLESIYGYGRADVHRAISELLANRSVAFEYADVVHLALRAFAGSSADLADCFIGEINRGHGCEATATFDRKAAKLDGFVLVR